jgi:7,8-dihydropterin-6-yl-methyl-4-(beta-D-ribofuranosyl)aminobenzene 5'-phosphate synthase
MRNGLRTIKAEYQATGGTFIVHDKQLVSGVVVEYGARAHRGQCARRFRAGFNTDNGLVILTGCGHAGIVNIAEYAVSIVPGKSLLAIVGALHWYRIDLSTRDLLGLTRKTAVVSVVGSTFTLGSGIDPRFLAQ